MKRGSGVPRQLPTTAFGGGFWCRFAAGTTQPGPLREALPKHPRSSLRNALEGIANG